MENILYEIVEKAKKYDNLLLLNKSKKELHCSFCGKSESSVKKLIAANDGICICNECVDLCYEILYKDSNKNRNN